MSGRWRRWNDWPLAAKGVAVIALPLALWLASLISDARLRQQITRAENEVRITQHIQAGIQTLHALIAEAATGVRGYLLTGRDDFLSPYWTADTQLPGTLDELDREVRDPAQRERLKVVRSLVERKLASLDELRTRGRFLAANELQAHLLSSKHVLDQLREQIQALWSREAELLTERTERVSAVLQHDGTMTVGAALLAVTGGVLAMLLFSAGIVRRVRRVAANADRLLQGQDLLPTPVARDELGLLAGQLQNASQLLASRAAEAQAASRAKSDFLSRTSHELRTPLNAILGFAQLLAVDLPAEPAAGKVGHILKAGRHLLKLIDEVLDIARIEAGQLKLECVVVPLAPLLAEAYALVLPLAVQNGVVLDPPPPCGAAVLGDRQRLLQVLLNLLSNAIKYNRKGGWVRLAVHDAPAALVLQVRDSGPGIAPAHLPRLFTPFDRLEATLHGAEGTGLGLTVSRQLIEGMGGTISVESQPGVGSVFSVHLPQAARADQELPDSAPEPPAAAALSAAAPVQARRTLLCIEDNASNLALVEALVARRPQWLLRHAGDGAAGLEAARALSPDLILLDLQLPGLGGEAVLAALRADPRCAQTPVVLVSADALPATRARLLAAGANDYLTKPLEVPEFFALLDAHKP